MSAQAVAGRFQSRGGEDFVHYLDNSGTLLCAVESDGAVRATSVKFPDGSTQASAATTTGSTIDAGTF